MAGRDVSMNQGIGSVNAKKAGQMPGSKKMYT